MEEIKTTDIVVQQSQPPKWYSVIYIVKYTSQYGRYFDTKIKFVSNSFIETFKEYMSKYLFLDNHIIETGVHPEAIASEILFNCPSFTYQLRDNKVVEYNNINFCEDDRQFIFNIKKSLQSYMQKFLRHIYSTTSKIKLCCVNYCYDIDGYLSVNNYRHIYNFDTEEFTTSKVDKNDKFVVYKFL